MIKDSGARRAFASGAVRDITEGKGRCDILPLKEVAEVLDSRELELVASYIDSGDVLYLYEAIEVFHEEDARGAEVPYSMPDLMLSVSKHFEAGCIKYGEPKPETGYLSNWQLGIPLHCYIDSGVRHYLKHVAGYTDERHDLSFVWNLLCCVWTQRNKPELIDLPFAGAKESEVREVKRPAMFGEWIKIVDCDDTRYENGFIFKVARCHGNKNGVIVVHGVYEPYVQYREYVVLEGYEPKKPEVNN